MARPSGRDSRPSSEPSPEDLELGNLADPLTLHSLLGYSRTTGRFLYHENNRLAGRVVVVDEASMIDLVLMERLVRSLRDDARLVLLGDDHQLPSVEAGAVLRDLIAGESPLGSVRGAVDREPPAAELDAQHSQRLARDRSGDAARLRPGSGPARPSSVERASVSGLSFEGVEFLESAEGSGVLAEFLDHWHARMIRGGPDIDALVARDYDQGPDGFGDDDLAALSTLFKHFDRSRILCLTRVRATGAERINASLHRRALELATVGSATS